MNIDLKTWTVASLGGGAAMVPAMTLALDANFGSVDGWRDDFVACAKKHEGKQGWLLLVFKPREGILVNQWVADQAEAVAAGEPILVMQSSALAESIGSINWAAAYERYQHAVHAAGEPFGATADELSAQAGGVLLDVRRAGVFKAAPTMLPGARWHDPAHVAHWAGGLPTDRPVTVYCVYGHEVGRVTALRLRAAGVDARYLHGGIDAWQSAGRAVVDKRAGDMS